MVISDPVSMTASSAQARRLDLGQDQLAALAPGGDHDVAGRDLHRLRASSTLIRCFSKSIISRCWTSASMPSRPSPPRSDSRSAGSFEVADGARSEGQLVDLHAVDEVAAGHAVEDRRRAQRQLQVARDAQADRRGIGAAVDDEVVGPAAVHLHVDAEARFDLARFDVVAADGERWSNIGRRQRRNVRRPSGGAGCGLLIFGACRRPPKRRGPGQRASERTRRSKRGAA